MNDATFLDFVMLCMFALPLLAVATMAFLFWRKDKQQREANERIFALLLRRDEIIRREVASF